MKRSQRNSSMNFGSVSPAENDYLITRCDPFHDTNYNPVGGPGSAPTVVRQYRRTATFTCPDTVSAAPANWSLSVGNMPNGNPLSQASTGAAITSNACLQVVRAWENSGGNATRFTVDLNYEYGGNNSVITYAPASATSLNGTYYPLAPVFAVATSNSTWQTTQTVATGTPNVFSPAASVGKYLSICQFGENVYVDGPSKLISVAYEVHMTSSDLYNQGVLTIGRVPQALAIASCKFNTAATTNVTSNITASAVLPTNSSELLLFQGARQWPAKFGCYAVAPEASSVTPDFDASPFASHATRTISWQASRSLPSATGSLGCFTSTRSADQYSASTEHFDNVIAMFEGLHPQCVMVVTTILTYETIPTDSTALRPLSRMPMTVRPHIIEAYAAYCADAEPFCMVGENSSGRFFAKVKRGFSKALSTIGNNGHKLLSTSLGALEAIGGSKPAYALALSAVDTKLANLAKRNQKAAVALEAGKAVVKQVAKAQKQKQNRKGNSSQSANSTTGKLPNGQTFTIKTK